MIIRQTTTIVFEYPQDYLQEQEWCKTKDDRWIHKSTDTMCTVYENTISYSIGQPNSSEKPNNCKDEPQNKIPCYGCEFSKLHYMEYECLRDSCKYEDEPQTDCAWK